jgi:CRP/FNR family transcriptional regulator, cyclic AMP receptor protein
MTGALPFLKRVPLFSGLDEAALALLARVSRTRQLPKGYVLFSRDDPGDAAYVVRSGCITILLTTPDGRELVINEMRPGDCFGEVALLTGQPRSAGAVAREASEVVVIPREEFLAEVESEPKLMRHLLETIAQRLRLGTEREGALAFLDAPQRLARILLQLDREASADGFVTISQEEIAQHIGVARQTAAKILGQWRRAGWIITGRGKIVLLNRAALRRRAEELQP